MLSVPRVTTLNTGGRKWLELLCVRPQLPQVVEGELMSSSC